MFVKVMALDQAKRESRISINTDHVLAIQPFSEPGIVPQISLLTMSVKDMMLAVIGSVESLEKICNTGGSSLIH